MTKRKSSIIWTATATLLIMCVAVVAHAEGESHDNALHKNLVVFNALVKELETNYVDSIRTDEAFKAAIAAYVSTIDPYTEYYDTEGVERLSTLTTGEYGGIGSYIMERKGNTFISAPHEGSPSAEVGLKAGDMIVKIDSVDAHGMKSEEVTRLLKGVPGSHVTVTVNRPYVGADSLLTFDITRRRLQIPSVSYYGVVDGTTGYIRLESFIDKSPEEVKEALLSFKENPEVTNIVLDLRGNGGGLLESAVEILSFFLPKGTEVLRTQGHDENTRKIYKTTKSPIMPDIPLAVLIDGGSASASEITAGALQDLDRAVLIGSRSFGKGLVQSSRPLPYDGLIKYTVAKYYLPSGRLIQALDYSRRNPDGTVAHTPDSLSNLFRTRAGREIRDGGGLKPDIEVSWGNYNPLLYNLVSDFWIFDYATRYAAEHDSIAAPADFVVTAEMYDDFKKGIDAEKLSYENRSKGLIEALRQGAEQDGYLNDDVKATLDTLASQLNHDLQSDLEIPVNKKEITDYLAEEILGRYYFDKGKTIYSLRSDPGVEKAREILTNREDYEKLLKP